MYKRQGHNDATPWPLWPLVLRTSTSHEEGGERDWSILTKSFSGTHGRVEKLHAVRLEWSAPDANGRARMQEIPGSEFEVECDLVLLALGFVHPEHGLARALGPRIDAAVIDDSITRLADIWEGEEARSGIQAFLDKRPPPWS